MPSGAGAKRDDSASDTGFPAADTSGRADSAGAAFTAANSPAGSTAAGHTGRTQQFGSEVETNGTGRCVCSARTAGGGMQRTIAACQLPAR